MRGQLLTQRDFMVQKALDPILGARISEDLLDRFDALARPYGGRGPFLRMIVSQVVEANGPAQAVVNKQAAPRDRMLKVSLRAAEIEAVSSEASELKMSAARWVALLVQRRIDRGARLDFEFRRELASIRYQLQGVARNLNQATRAANASMMEDSGMDLRRELNRIADMKDEIKELIGAMNAALKADYSYWNVP